MAQAHEMPNVLEAQRAHDELVSVALARAKLDRYEAHWLIVAYRTRAHRLLELASFAHCSSSAKRRVVIHRTGECGGLGVVFAPMGLGAADQIEIAK